MVQELTVENVAVIERASFRPGAAFTVLTGETGAGKSLLVDAIGLALGARADADLVRHGAARAVVTLLVDLRGNPLAMAKCAEHGVAFDDGQLVVQREVSHDGRSTVRLNGRPAAVGTLREIGALLVDLHGQHDHQALMHQERQGGFLDAWIGDEALALVVAVEEQFRRHESLARRLASLRNGQRAREQRVDLLKFQIDEIQSVSPVVGETEELEGRLLRLKHVARLTTGVRDALAALADDEGSAVSAVQTSLRALRQLADLDPSLGVSVDHLAEGEAVLVDAVRGVRAYAATLDDDPAALEEVAARLDLLSRLKRKYGEDEAAILEHLAAASAELATLEGEDMSEDELAVEVDAAHSTLQATADRLTSVREAHAAKFSEVVTAELRELAMPSAEFVVRLHRQATGPEGQDFVEFLFTANAGEPPRPLGKVASGGELSRLMLAVKVASAGRAGVPTLIFDEIDTGLSGRAAATAARKMAALAAHNQVMAISHLPQIAAAADVHFLIRKSEAKGRVHTSVDQLDAEERVDEVARMIAGEEVGESARTHAREMLRAID
ncbi:MAG: DNA repair protein RecN [Fimbriimonadaceae bacterium]|nr:DNA repair protein RecN [Fimbriimonadaceae bacterium]